MENAGKALEIAAGVMLGVMLMALIVYFFKTAGEWPQQQADMKTVEQTAKFNAEYEVYNKRGMYGVDVISCLNKAIDNNDKYILDESSSKLGFLTEGKRPKEYCINVFVRFKGNNTKLTESVEVRYLSNESVSSVNAKTGREGLKTFGNAGITMKEAFPTAKFAGHYTKFTEGTLLETSDNLIDLGSPKTEKGYQLLIESGNELVYDDSNILYQLMRYVGDNLSFTVKNPDSNTLNNWSSATWQTALYDLKKKRFRCDDIAYDENTKRVKEIYFYEI